MSAELSTKHALVKEFLKRSLRIIQHADACLEKDGSQLEMQSDTFVCLYTEAMKTLLQTVHFIVTHGLYIIETSDLDTIVKRSHMFDRSVLLNATQNVRRVIAAATGATRMDAALAVVLQVENWAQEYEILLRFLELQDAAAPRSGLAPDLVVQGDVVAHDAEDEQRRTQQQESGGPTGRQDGQDGQEGAVDHDGDDEDDTAIWPVWVNSNGELYGDDEGGILIFGFDEDEGEEEADDDGEGVWEMF